MSDNQIILQKVKLDKSLYRMGKDKAINSNMKPLSFSIILFMVLNVQLTRVTPKSRDHTISTRDKFVDLLFYLLSIST